MKLFALLTISCFLFIQIDAAQIFYTKALANDDWTKNAKFKGCLEPTEPFNCPDSNRCISLQFICDGIPGDCPNNYDEDEHVCNAYHRPPKDTIIRFLSVQYANHGKSFIIYLFGKNAAQLFKKLEAMHAFSIIATNLAVSRTIDEFSQRMDMSVSEKNRLLLVIEKVNTGKVDSLPKFIRDSITEGLSSLVDNLIKTHFTDNKN